MIKLVLRRILTIYEEDIEMSMINWQMVLQIGVSALGLYVLFKIIGFLAKKFKQLTAFCGGSKLAAVIVSIMIIALASGFFVGTGFVMRDWEKKVVKAEAKTAVSTPHSKSLGITHFKWETMPPNSNLKFAHNFDKVMNVVLVAEDGTRKEYNGTKFEFGKVGFKQSVWINKVFEGQIDKY